MLPLKLKRRATIEANQEIADFSAKSLLEKRDLLREKLHKHFVRLGYHATVLNSRNDPVQFSIETLHALHGAEVGVKRERGVFHFAFLHVVPSITQSLSQEYRYGLIRGQPYGYHVGALLDAPKWGPKSIKEEILICSFGTSGTSRLAKQIPYLCKGGNDGTLEYHGEAEIVVTGRRERAKVERHVTLRVVESVAQLVDLEEMLNIRFPLPACAARGTGDRNGLAVRRSRGE
jgi:hypothetical protein